MRNIWYVGSESHPDRFYQVSHRGDEDRTGWVCTCPDWEYRRAARHEDCKHIAKVRSSEQKPNITEGAA